MRRTTAAGSSSVGATVACIRRPKRSTSASATCRANAGSKVWCCSFPFAANITLADLENLSRHGLINAREERRLATSWVKRLKVRTPGINALCLNLSGGNQQKVVLAKWLNAKAQVLILDHPTRGLDVGAKEEVYDLVRQVTAEGVAVILTSDTLEETIGLSHTVLVMRDGEITHRTSCQPG